MTVAVSESEQTVSSFLDDLRATLPGLDDKQIVQTIRDLESLSRRTHSVMLAAVAEAESRGIAAREGFGATHRMLAATLHLSGTEARARTEQAAALTSRRAITGAALPPKLPATAAALTAGRLGPGHLTVITEAMALLPLSVPEPVRERMEADLAHRARDFDPRRLRLLAHRMLAQLDPDGAAPDPEPEPTPPVRGELWLRDRHDGRLGLEGWLDAEHGTLFRKLIEQLAAPRPTADGMRDERTPPARQADALIELCDRARTADDFPASGGEPPHLTVTIDWEALRTGVGAASLDYGQQISAAEARRWACDCAVIPVVLGGESEPLDVGRSSRTVPRGIRRALVARDRGCCFPGCDRPPQLCAGHHIKHWADGGETSISNCCLLCPVHHQQVHLQGWDITIEGGRVEFHPPAIIDPDRRPLTNPLRT